MKFTHLHVHTHYSLLDGLAKVDDILDRAQELGMDSLAITDHGVLYGAIEFYIKAKARGIKPIIGCEMYLTPTDLHSKDPSSADRKRFHLILLAKNEAGYKNLMRLITIAHLEGFYYKPRIDKKVLRAHSDGLIGLSACADGEVPAAAISGNMEKAEKLALEYQDIFGAGNFYLEIQHHPDYAPQKVANDALIEISKKYNIPLVATNDIHYVREEDAPIQDILLCIQTNRRVEDKNRMNLMDFKLHLKSPEEMAEQFKDIPEALENTQAIVDKCNLEIKLGETQLPSYDVPEGETTETYLRKLTEEGLFKRFGNDVLKVHRDRMEYELGVIEKTGFASYFLIVQDFMNWAKNEGIIVGPGRGSAAGSFVSYLIGITNIDPIKFDLLFERFLNPERISMPDIDMDFADDRRDEVLDYVRKKYGNDHVAQIITFGTMAARAAIRDAGRALNIPYEFCDKTAKLIPMFSTIEEALINAKEFKDLYVGGSDAKKLIDSAKRLEGVVRHASMHACGVVITREPVTEYTPLQKIQGKKTGSVTQYSSSTKSSFVEKIGLLKMDFLGLKNLTIMQNTLRILRKTKSLDLKIDNIPEADEKTFELLKKAQTTGVFQLESSGMKRYLKLLQPSVFEDIIAMVALYRPGPMDWIPDFIARKHGEKRITYLHPKLEPILEKTYGVAVYQEQIMQIAQALAGFTLGEADVLRKAMGKKIFSLIAEQKIKFIESCVKNNVNKNIAEKVFAYIEPFAGYGFNRCLTGDTLITDAITGKQFKLEEIQKMHKHKKKLLEILTLDNNLKLTKSKIAKAYSNGTKEIFEIKTALGKILKATGNHPFRTISGWKNLEELKIGNRIAMARKFFFTGKEVLIENYKLIVLGYLIAEGNLCHPSSFYFYSKNSQEINDYAKNLKKFKNTQAKIDRSKSAASVYAGRIDLRKKSEAVEWVKSIGIHYKKATVKELPDFVFNLSTDQLSLLVGKMFQGDGCINLSRKDPQIFYATSSKKLAEQLQHLFLRLEIISTIHRKKFRYRNMTKIGYTLTISRYTNIYNFFTGPGKYLIGEKAITLKKAIRKHPIINGSLRENCARGSYDIIPAEILNIMTAEIKKTGLSLKEFAKKNNLAERLFFQDKRKIGYLRETIVSIGKILESQKLLELGESDIYWDKIISIKKIGREKTYDLTIKGTHNFLANDFVVHNSHAACYALIGYQTAYLKAHYPAEFMAALLTSDQDDIDRVAIEVTECREMGIEVLPPNVNESFEEFSVIIDPETKTEKIRFGLNAVKNVGHTVANVIVEERKRNGKFTTLANFIERVESKDLNKKSIEALAKVGALEDLGERNQIVVSIENILAHSKNFQKNKNSNQISLFGVEELAEPEIQLLPAFPATKKQQLSWEKELMGLYISGHPASEFQAYLESAGVPIRDVDKNLVGQSINLGGVISKVKKIFLKNQKTMLFATIEDTTSSIEFIVFPKVLEETGSLWEEDKIILASGKISDKDGTFKLLVDSAKIINQTEIENSARILATRKMNGDNKKNILISLPATAGEETLKALSIYFKNCPLGPTKIYLKINGTKLETPFSITYNPEIKNRIQEIIPNAVTDVI